MSRTWRIVTSETTAPPQSVDHEMARMRSGVVNSWVMSKNAPADRSSTMRPTDW